MNSPSTGRTYWFPARRYGWGWGLPLTWQGWIVLLAFFALFGAGFVLYPPKGEIAPFLVYELVLAAVLTAICWLKGEPPRWRWGGDAGA